MALLDIRQRAGYLFLAVTLGHIVLISAQVQSRRGVPVLEAVTFGIFAEVQRGGSAALSYVREAWRGYVGLRGVREENDRLQRELMDARLAAQTQRAAADAARGLERTLALREQLPLETTAARVIAGAGAQKFRTITIDKGSLDGLAAPMAVITPAGVVGRIVITSPRAAKVQLLVDGTAAAGAIIERSRAQAMAVGGDDRIRLQDDRLLGLDDRMRLTFVPEVADIVTGDVVLTSGTDGIFPKGFTIGRVEAVERSGGGYKTIVVRPAVDFSSLEDVLVILTPPASREAVQEEQR